LQKIGPEQKLKQRERTLERWEISLVISWLGMGVARELILNASVPMVGWKDEHPQSVGWQQPVIDKHFLTLCNLAGTEHEFGYTVYISRIVFDF
jgi:hypothetical protein